MSRSMLAVLAMAVLALTFYALRKSHHEDAAKQSGLSIGDAPQTAQRSLMPSEPEGWVPIKTIGEDGAPKAIWGRPLRGPLHWRKVIAKEAKKLSAAHAQEFLAATAKLELEVQALEAQNLSKAYENELPDRHVLAFAVAEPKGDQLARAHGKAKEIAAHLSVESTLQG